MPLYDDEFSYGSGGDKMPDLGLLQIDLNENPSLEHLPAAMQVCYQFNDIANRASLDFIASVHIYTEDGYQRISIYVNDYLVWDDDGDFRELSDFDEEQLAPLNLETCMKVLRVQSERLRRFVE